MNKVKNRVGIESRPVIIPKIVFDTILKQENPLGLISLYSFYYYTAVWQETSQPRATVSYVAKGLKIGIDKVRKLRGVLLKLGLIEDVQEHGDKGNFSPRYVKVNYVPVLLSARSTRNTGGKCLVTNSKTVVGKPNHKVLLKKTKKDFNTICTKKLLTVILQKRKLCRKVNRKQWNIQFQKLQTDVCIKKRRIKKVLLWYIKHFGEEYVPKAYSARGFCNKFPQIEDAMERALKDAKSGKKVKYRTRTIK